MCVCERERAKDVMREYENECENVWVREKKIECVRENKAMF